MLFNRKAEIEQNNQLQKTDLERPEAKQAMEDNSKMIDWLDILALFIAGVQVIAPRALILILMYSMIGLFFYWFVAN